MSFINKMEQVFGKSFRQVDDLYYDISKEVNFGENVELNDNKALKYLQDLHIKKGKLYVITDFCYYKKSGPFIVEADMIESFVDTFYETFREDFYSTDIIIVNFPFRNCVPIENEPVIRAVFRDIQ